MKTVKITREVKIMIEEFSRNESVNDAVNRLLDLSEPPLRQYGSRGDSINIGLDEATLNRLKEYKLSESETHSETILRLLTELE